MKKTLVITLFFVACAKTSSIDWDNLKEREINPAFPLFKPGKTNGRVVGGEEATPHQFPFQAGLFMTLNNGQQAFCGGSLISPNSVLTAAHCVDGTASVKVILGAHKIWEQEASQVEFFGIDFIMHPEWDSVLMRNDIAIVKLPTSVKLNKKIALVKLPSRSDVDETFVNKIATVSGWGTDSDSATGISPVLRYTSNDVISNSMCSLSYLLLIQRSNICVNGRGRKSPCKGDLGGPLTIKQDNEIVQIGLVSFGHALGCEKGYPAVYTRLTSYLDWIREVTLQ